MSMNSSQTNDLLKKYLGLGETDYFVIGEIGVNHNGDMENVRALIDLAVRCELNAVKFQKRTPDICTPPAVRETIRETPWGAMTYLDYRRRIELSQENYEEIDAYCKERGILWFASSWDIDSTRFLDQFHPQVQKVASAMNSNVDFLKDLASRKIFTIISTGMSTIKEIDEVVDIFKQADCPYMLFHTTSTYPASDNILNISAIRTLESRYKVPVGYSGHESSTFPSQVAAVIGARVIERHITLDRAMWGSDQAASLSEQGLHELVTSLKRIPNIMGDGIKKIEEGEDLAAKRLRWWL
jgi:N-acetylneuraminate synthase